jgi:hypothetical protein
MEDRVVVRNLGLAIGVIMLMAVGLITLATVLGNAFS